MKNHLLKKISTICTLLVLSVGAYAQSADTKNHLFTSESITKDSTAVDSLNDILLRETIQYFPNSYTYFKNGEAKSLGLFGKEIKKEFSKSKEALVEYKKFKKLKSVSGVLMISGLVGCGAILTVVASPLVISSIGVAVVTSEILALRSDYLSQKRLAKALSIYNNQMVLQAVDKSVK